MIGSLSFANFPQTMSPFSRYLPFYLKFRFKHVKVLNLAETWETKAKYWQRKTKGKWRVTRGPLSSLARDKAAALRIVFGHSWWCEATKWRLSLRNVLYSSKKQSRHYRSFASLRACGQSSVGCCFVEEQFSLTGESLLRYWTSFHQFSSGASG